MQNLEAISILRKKLKLTSKDMADKLGMSQPTYWNYENGRYKWKAEHLPKLAEALGVSVDYLLSND